MDELYLIDDLGRARRIADLERIGEHPLVRLVPVDQDGCILETDRVKAIYVPFWHQEIAAGLRAQGYRVVLTDPTPFGRAKECSSC